PGSWATCPPRCSCRDPTSSRRSWRSSVANRARSHRPRSSHWCARASTNGASCCAGRSPASCRRRPSPPPTSTRPPAPSTSTSRRGCGWRGRSTPWPRRTVDVVTARVDESPGHLGDGGAAHLDAPAKLTTELRITGVRDDGYHLIDAEMVSLELADVVTIEPGGDGIAVTGPFAAGVPVDHDNLVARALRLVDRRAAVTIDKRIPHGGG